MEQRYSLWQNATRAKAAFQSKSPAARLAFLLKGLRPFSTPLDKWVQPRPEPNRARGEEALPPIVMIVSPPRSGSTITYQVLVRAIPSVYISNLHFILPMNASKIMLRGRLFGRQLDSFNNYYGYTSSVFDVNEGNEIIESLFFENAGEETIRRRFIRMVHNICLDSGRPLIFKNVRAYSELARLRAAVPEIFFLRVKRDPSQVIQSELKAYHELKTFHPIPKALAGTPMSDPVDFAVRQILTIEHTLDEFMDGVPASGKATWRYEDFCQSSNAMIRDLAEAHLHLDSAMLRLENIPSLKASTRPKVTRSEELRIERAIQHHGKILAPGG